ncbi:MAG: ATP-binding protein, partial [Tannerellaceae bacterium]|nr:ATP-binding protein [Tannerellaceae bacterium]
MKFYNRGTELEALGKMRELSFNVHAQMTVLTGRRRIGKTSLIFKSCEDTPTIYLFVNRGNEAALCKGFAEAVARTFDIYVPEVTNFAGLFTFLMDLGERRKYNLVIDEFQEFFYINPVVYSQMQDIWDRYRKKSNVNLIVSGSVYTLMNRIFKDYKEPLYGRADSILKLAPFSTDVIKEILNDYKPDYSNDDLLALYTFTGGIPKYIELFMNQGATDMGKMVDLMTRSESPFVSEGNTLLIQEFGRKYGNYFSILTAIANSKNT